MIGISGFIAWPACVVVLLWFATTATVYGQTAQRPWMRIVRGDVEVVGNADPVYLRNLASHMAGVREALTAVVPATKRIAVPVTVIVDCDGSEQSGVSERPWRVYITGRCGRPG